MAELISVIVPIYNVEPYLRQCIESIINQTYRNIEIILVDDGSTDKCGDICDEYAAKDQRIKVIHKKNGGQDSARKEGMKIAQGVYIGYVDGDDWIEPEMYESLYKLAKKSGALIVESGVIDTYTNKAVLRKPFYTPGFYSGKKFQDTIPTIIHTGNFFKHGIFPYLVTKLFYKDCIFKYQMMSEESNNLVDDVMCVFPCVINTQSIYITDECFYHYRIRNSSTKRSLRNDVADIIKANYSNWLKRFNAVGYEKSIQSQLNFFIMYLLASKAIYIFDLNQSDLCLIPYGGIKKSSKIVLYGAGAVGIQLYNYISNSDCCSIVYWADKNYSSFSDLDVKSPENIINIDFDYLIIAIFNRDAYISAKKSLISMGINENKIRWIDEKYLNNPKLLLEQCNLFNDSKI
ncbi:glycosyltransferase family 2 protein [Clostridium thermarum]|uniref:glycosyltransferase family 2 protein n=1 Tax=Clostridium thermarum TaxID=1716543 RepID=UPI001121FB97|nr:glycosyltransferase family 2 protein [Clostridium thermarum]